MQIFVVDAFTDCPFGGNPAAVCVTQSALPEEKMQLIAAEMRHSETVFVCEPQATQATAGREQSLLIRWFTPTNEVNLCGHATLAASYVLFQQEHCFQNLVSGCNASRLHFVTKEGTVLSVTKVKDAAASGNAACKLALDFPCYPPVELWTRPSHATVADAKFDEVSCFLNSLNHGQDGSAQQQPLAELLQGAYISKDTKKLIYVFDAKLAKGQTIDLASITVSNEVMADWAKQTEKLAADPTNLLGSHVRGIVFSSENGDDTSGQGLTTPGFSTRYFSPWNGIGEDPVNGSSHTVLTPLWRGLFANSWGCSLAEVQTMKSSIKSKRGGTMWVQVVDGSDGTDRVEMAGSAYLVLKGELFT